MALGSNLKRQKLIPTEPKEPSEKTTIPKKAVVKKTVTKKAKSTKKLKAIKTVVEKSVAKPKKTAKTKPKTSYVSKEIFDFRQGLRKKYNDEIDKLKEEKLQLIVFQLGDNTYALELKYLKKVVKTPVINKMPNLPSHIIGAVSVRNIIMPLFDLELKYKMKVDLDIETIPEFTMVIETELGSIGILTKSVPSTLIINGHNLEKLSGLISDIALDETFIKGLIKADQYMVFLIDINELIANDRIKISANN